MLIREYVLKFKDLNVGQITIFQSGELSFEYSKEFIRSGFSPLPSFPDFSKTYKNQSVVNFLMNRIPPKVIKANSGINFYNSSDLMAIGRKVSHSPIEVVARGQLEPHF